jgi:hypothetical protein
VPGRQGHAVLGGGSSCQAAREQGALRVGSPCPQRSKSPRVMRFSRLVTRSQKEAPANMHLPGWTDPRLLAVQNTCRCAVVKNPHAATHLTVLTAPTTCADKPMVGLRKASAVASNLTHASPLTGCQHQITLCQAIAYKKAQNNHI